MRSVTDITVPKWLVRQKHEYAAKPQEPLLIVARLLTGYVPATPEGGVHLDSLLAWAVVNSLPYPPPPEPEAYCSIIPVPLELLWVSSAGLPLWAASELLPGAETLRSQEYWHKRYPGHRAELGTRVAASPVAGRYKEQRRPVQVVRTERLEAVCIGHRETIERMLSLVSHVGKKVAAGYGRVEWRVIPLGWTHDETVHHILDARPVPVEYYTGNREYDPWFDGVDLVGLDRPFTALAGWTPPYWHAPWYAPCLLPRRDNAQPV